MSKKKRVPELRFTGFVEEWSEQKLGSITELNPKTEIPEIFEYVDLESVVGTELISHRQESKKSAPSRAKRHAKKGDLFFQTVRPYQKNNYLYLLPNRNYVFSTGYAQLRPAVDSSFLLGLVQTDLFVNEVLIRCTGTGYPAINSNELADILVFYSLSDDEQTKIGNFLMNIDTLITLYQRNYDKLCTFKKAMLEKMFTKAGADEPEIRFKSFAGKWIKDPLSFYLYPSTEKNFEGKYNKENVLSVSGEVGIVNQIEFQGRSFAGASVANYGVVHTGDVVYTKSPLKSNPYGIIKANMGEDGIVSTLYAVYKAKKVTYSCFVNYYFCSDFRLNCYLKPLVNKGAKNDMKVTSENALLGKVIFPQIIEEQIKIVAFFEKVDSLISLHQRELDKLKHIKQACLEKMFV